MSVRNPYEYRTPNDAFYDLSFNLFTSREMLRSSCKEIRNSQTFDQLMHPVESGLYDPALGPVDRFANCITCQKPEKLCPGHFGHITLPLPVYNPVFFRLTLDILKGSCLVCHKLYIERDSVPVELLLAQLRALNLGLISEVDTLKNEVTQIVSKELLPQNLEGDNMALDSEKNADKADDVIFQASMFSKADTQVLKQTADHLRSVFIDGCSEIKVNCRNINQKRQQLVREFCSKYLFARPRRCPHCTSTTIAIRHQYLQSILVGSKSNSWKTDLMLTKKLPKAKKEETTSSFDDILANDFSGTGKAGKDGLPFHLPKSNTIKESGDILEQMKNLKQDLDELEEIAESLPDYSNNVNVENTKLDGKGAIITSDGLRYMSPIDVKLHFRQIWAIYGDVLSKVLPIFHHLNPTIGDNKKQQQAIIDFCPTDVLFFDVLPVVPSKFRPISRLGSMQFENGQALLYKKILEQCEVLRFLIELLNGEKAYENQENRGEKAEKLKKAEDMASMIPGKDYTTKFHNAYIQLQSRINILFDGDLDRLNRDKVAGIKQLLEKKEGLFRKHMMGKRVNYCCRTVITPDPYQEIDQIGIPDIFAKKLTYPAPVNGANLSEMRNLVELGPNSVKGANYVINEDGSRMRLDPDDANDRRGIAKRLLQTDFKALRGCKKVCRHLANGDVMLLNRQPTLHKPSIQAHRARIIHGQKVIRLHYAVCKPYNADFDGDEMNAHFPQNDIARCEGYDVAAVPFQYLVPKDGTPILGLIQDHIVSGVLLTMKNQFFSKEDYQFLVLSAFGYLNKKLKFLTPAVIKPVKRWTGKQVVSTVVLNVIPDGKPLINLSGKSKTSVKSWQITGHSQPDFKMSESEVIFRGGELLSGVLDKADYGPTAFGLIHCCYELYHPKVAARLLSCFSRLFTTFLQYNGFSLGIADVLVSDTSDSKRQKIIDELRRCGLETVKSVLHLDQKRTENEENENSTNNLEEENEEEMRPSIKSKLEEVYLNDDTSHIKELDYAMKIATDKFNDKVNKACLPHGLLKVFPENSLQCMIESGAKGNMVNQVQMSCMLGQIELEGCRPPLMPSGRTLPSFEPYDYSPRAGGFVDGRFATGIRPQEFFFHTMAGREGLIDTAVKTSRSGYLQRCIIKHLEGVMVNYDSTVRDSDSSIIQFQYGDDGSDIGQSQFLNESRFDILANNLPILLDQFSQSPRFKAMNTKTSDKIFKKIKKWKKKRGGCSAPNCKSYSYPFTLFSSNWTPASNRVRDLGQGVVFDQSAIVAEKGELVDRFRRLDAETLKELAESFCPDPANAKLNASVNFGVLPEKLMDELDRYLAASSSSSSKSWNGSSFSENFRKAIYWKSMLAQCQPGDPVGIVAAQSIGEPSTQMTLNTFHFAGRGEMNVTLGIPRLREILMTASANIATPTAQVPVLPNVPKETADNIKRVMDRLFLKQFLKSMRIYEQVKIEAGQFYNHYIVEMCLLKRKKRPDETKHIDNFSVLTRMEKRMFKAVCIALKRKIEKSQTEIKGSVKKALKSLDAGGSARNVHNEENSDNEAEQQGEADAADERRLQRQNDETEYLGEAEEKYEVMPSDDEESNEDDESDVELGSTIKNEVMEGENSNQPHLSNPAALENDLVGSKKPDANRIKNVLLASPLIVAYDYDAKRNSWCKVTIQTDVNTGTVDVASVVADEIERFVVQETPGIQRCILREENNQLILQTEGINLESFYSRADVLDVNKISCNDIHLIARTYGIEAAAKALVKEIKMVFGAYGIQVDHRHLSLVSDYMTHTGAYTPFNRTYMATSTSPLQKMSFETTTAFLRDAIYLGEKEDLRSPSSRLVVGALTKIGTGCFDLMVDMKNNM